MAGKKTGKRLLTWVLVLVMALSLLPLNALAADGSETDSSSGMIFTKKLVFDTPDEKGNYTIQMTAQATGKEVETTKVKPMDIVLVLDQSGSMADDFNGKTTYKDEARRQYAMKEAVNSFIGEVAKKYGTNADHRMAIVTFDSDAKTLASWTAVDKDGGASELTGKISALSNTPSGATNVGAGMELAQTLMDNDAYTGDNTDRQKTVIVFTDGVPTTQRDFDTDVANEAISAAKSMKAADVAIYTVGIFKGADPKQLHGDKWNYAAYPDVSCNGEPGSYWGGSWVADLFGSNDFEPIDVPAGNRFLNYLSSNSDDASEIGITKGRYDPRNTLVKGAGWRIDKNADCTTNKGYYKTAVDASDLNGIFKTISDMVPEPDNAALDEKTVITDTLSDYFMFAGTVEDVKVYAEKPDGTPRDIGLSNGPDGIDVNGKTVTVTGYDFSAYHTKSENPEKLVIEIKVKPDSTGCNSAEIPTNKGNATVTLDNKEIDKATPPTVDGYSVTYAIGDNVSWPTNNSNGPATLYYPQKADVPVTDIEPTREGFKFNGWTSDIESDNNVYTSNGTNSITMPAANVVLTPKWTPNSGTKYTVRHHQQNLDNDNYTLFETESDKTGTTGELTNATAKNYEGFAAKPFVQQAIAADGSTVVDIYYDRNTYSVTYTDGVNNETIFEDEVHQSVKYGASVPAYNNGTDPSRENYTFAVWEPSVPATMPANDLTFTAKWTKNTIPTYKFDLSNLDTIKVDKKFESKYGLGSPMMRFTATATIEKQETYIIVNPGIDNNVTNNGSAVPTKPDYTKVGEATGTVTLKAGKTTKAFDFGKESTFQLEPGDYRITVKETNSGDRYVTYDTKPYTRYFKVSEDGVISAIESITITNEYTKRHTAATPSKPTLNTGDHYAYVMGYPDGTVRPNGSITRAEVSAILFRLLSDKTRDEYFTTESSFTDVKAGAWYNNSIATLEKAGVIVDTAKGGAFRPNEAITRAELAAMLAQFSDAKPVKGVKFSDVPAEHWAYEAIAIAAKMGWIEGYPDGTFRPDATITRAEMMTLVNRALERVPSDEDHLLSKRVMLTFPDCKSGDWFYIAVQEATNSHTYERAATEKNGDEQWTALRANRDWTQLEK